MIVDDDGELHISFEPLAKQTNLCGVSSTRATHCLTLRGSDDRLPRMPARSSPWAPWRDSPRPSYLPVLAGGPCLHRPPRGLAHDLLGGPDKRLDSVDRRHRRHSLRVALLPLCSAAVEFVSAALGRPAALPPADPLSRISHTPCPSTVTTRIGPLFAASVGPVDARDW